LSDSEKVEVINDIVSLLNINFLVILIEYLCHDLVKWPS